ncbi:pseudouridine synthase [Sphingomonas donggukensis]|uniref:Pseudouridine synthase n=2 Tax=Sphingomonas donggukensis TaxID=2949093 RepID=A0ABY4TXM7_9SPHN|nr:pseudouridine synthase [Sphingomonas donggukensis]URW77141.1 pseudouridine synthase [Sphingomonas donggukensis]
MIAEGRVALNGVTLDTPATILTSLTGVTVDGVAVRAAEAARLFLFHKPSGLLTAANDPAGRPTIYDRLPPDLPRLMPVGRLDLATEGLLLMTTDGELKRQLELPATGVERAYRARAYGAVTQAQLEDLMDGVEVEGVRYGPIDANLERRTGANVWIEMVLTEGKNREVRRVLEHLGLRVSRLIRTRYGPFILGDMPVGAIGEVRSHDLDAFRARLKGNKAKATDDARANPIAVSVGAKPRRSAVPAPNPDVPAAPRRPATEPEGTRRLRPPVPRKREVREELDTRPQRPSRARPDGTAWTERPPAPRDRAAPPADAGGRSGRTDRAQRSERPARPSRDSQAAYAARPSTAPRGERPVAARPPRSAHAPRPDADAREDITTRPRRARAGPVTARSDTDTTPTPRPKRGAGWAKARPKPGAKPGKPRRPRS